MSNKEFIKQILKAGEQYTGTGGAGIIGRVLIEFGLHQYVTGHDFWSFWKAIPSGDEVDVIANELKSRLQKAGSTENPALGVKVTIKKDVLSRNEPYKTDLMEFIPAWQKDSFELITDAINSADLPIGKIFYGRVQYKANPHFVKKGEAGKTETDQNGVPRYPSVRVPIEKFTNEQVARNAVGVSSSSTRTSSTDSQYSETVRQNFDNIAGFEACFDQIREYYGKISKNELPYNGAPPLPQPLIEPKVKQYLSAMYDCEPADIDIVLNTAPF